MRVSLRRFFLLRNESSLVAECLTLLNDKIDTAIEQIATSEGCANGACQPHTPQICELSAEGMAFGTHDSITPGSKISLRFLIASDNRYIESFATVVRNVDPPHSDTESFPVGVAVEFHGMPAAQKEIIIQHLFSKESETLRMRRLDFEASG